MKRLWGVLRRLWGRLWSPLGRPKADERHFAKVKYVQRAPEAASLGPRDFFVVRPGEVDKWAVFSCPCRCKESIVLPLRNTHTPNWTLEVIEGYPSLKPSVWQQVGCRSHFWVNAGRVEWCGR